MTQQPDQQYVYKTTLRTTYGLTDSMIIQLHPPDKLVANPHYRSGPPASLYLIARVEAWIEAHQAEVDAARARHAQRSARASAANQVRMHALEAWAETVPILVGLLPATLEADATCYYASWERWDGGSVGYGGLVAYVRHQYTNYHALLAYLEGKPGASTAYNIVKTRVNQGAGEALEALEAG